MYLSGEIKFRAPGLKKQEFVINRKDGGELIIKHREGSGPEVENFDVWIEMNKDEQISIKTDAIDDGVDDLYIEIESKQGGKLSVNLSPSQVVALQKVLSRFIEIHSGILELRKVVRV